jgi:iron complex outermembrane receptor protein
MIMRRSQISLAVAVLVYATGSMSGFAQTGAKPEPKEDAIETVVVTAQRREQDIQDVPLSVSAISAETLTRQEATSTQSLMRLFPNLSGGQISGAGSNNYSMRGLSNAETAATFDSPVGTYLNGIYIARINANNFALFDVERIEVLRGPQGTLFGRNTTQGAINIVSKKPSQDFGVSAELSAGNYNHYQVRASADLPVSDTFRTRIAAYKLDEDGWADNITTGGTNNAHTGWGVRAAASIDFGADYIDDENPFIPVSLVNGDRITRSGLQPLGAILPGRKGQIPGNFLNNTTYGASSTLRFETAAGDLEVISGYRDLTARYSLDYFDNPSAIGGFDSVEYSTHTQFTQELKLSGTTASGFMGYTAGLFYFKEGNVSDYTTVFRLGSGVPFIDADRTLFNTGEAVAAYAQVDLNFTDQLALTLGARYTDEQKEIRYVNNGNPMAAVAVSDALLVAAGVPLKIEDAVVTPRVAVQFKPTDAVMLFASATRGFKSGGWNARSNNPLLLKNFGTESIWSYEAGIRSEFLDRRATANLTLFFGDTSNLQIATAVANPGGAPVFPVGNFSDFESSGAEFETNFRVTDDLTLFANAGYNKTEYQNPTAEVLTQQTACRASIAAGATARPNCAAGIVRADGDIAKPLRAPEFTGTLGFSWEKPVTENYQLVLSGSGRFVSKFNVNSAELATTWDPGYSMFSGTLAFERQDGRLQFSVGCENCTDRQYLISVIGASRWFSMPARYYGRVKYSF